MSEKFSGRPTPAEAEAFALANDAASKAHGTTSPNPPVGAVILDSSGVVAGVGATRPAGGPHAEIVALSAAGHRAAGGTAVVTLEPCNHTGRTGPCTEALLAAGIARVVFARRDPGAREGGGADRLAAAGVEVVLADVAVPDLEPWLAAVRLGRPAVTLKFAQTLDGFTAAEDGTSQWITGPTARRAVHEDRARRDAIIVGTGTALADDPRLTARGADGGLMDRQPRRVVIGTRRLPSESNLMRSGCERHAGIDEALAALWRTGARDVLVEGGASLASGFLAAGRVDFVQAYVAPTLLGSGRGVLAGPVATTLAGAAGFELTGVRRLGDDVLLELRRP